MKHRMTVTVDDASLDIVSRTGRGNVSPYLSSLILNNWRQWKVAYHDVRASGRSNAWIVSTVRGAAGMWLADNTRFEDNLARDVPPDLRVAVRQLAWEYWHDNQELRGLLHCDAEL